MSALDLVVSWLAYAGCLWLAALILPGFEIKDGIKGAALAAVLLGILNALTLWVVFGVLNLDGLLHFGPTLSTLLRWLITAGLLLATDRLSGAISIRNFGMAFLAAVIVTAGHELLAPVLTRLLHRSF